MGPHMRANSLQVKNMAMVSTTSLTCRSTWDPGTKMSSVAQASVLAQMDAISWVCGTLARCTARALISGQAERSTLENFTMTSSMALASFHGQTVGGTKAGG